jgi:hypothetical protein
MNEKWIRFTLVITVPVTFLLVLAGSTFLDRVLPEVVAGGLVAILGAIVATFAIDKRGKKDDDSD